MKSIQAVLFDLDGTLLDTAPDMASALNYILSEENLPELTLELIRPHVSKGGLALTQLAFQEHEEEQHIEPLRQRFLKKYLSNIAEKTTLFNGFDSVLEHLEKQQTPWGIVTNKPAWLTGPLLEQLNLHKRSAVTISGDTTTQRKPHPLPLQTAASTLNTDCKHCLYVGDDPRDIEAGNAAGMFTMIAEYGYIEKPCDFSRWNAHYQISHPIQILDYI